MIVIPTYDGYWQLTRLIKGLETFGTNGHKVVIMDDGTKDMVSVKYLDQLRAYTGNFDIVIHKADHKFGYEAGALVHAVRLHPEEETALLIQDSCVPLSDKWFTQFEEKLTPKVGAVTWVKFRPCLFFCGPDHLAYIDEVAGGHSNVPDGGFFGNIHYTYTSIVRDLDSKGYFTNLPKKKMHSECWERLWPIIYHIEGYKLACIIDEFNPNSIHNGMYPHFKKTFAGRQG